MAVARPCPFSSRIRFQGASRSGSRLLHSSRTVGRSCRIRVSEWLHHAPSLLWFRSGSRLLHSSRTVGRSCRIRVSEWLHHAPSLLGRSMLTCRLAIPFSCQVPARNSGLLLKLPITFDDSLMSEASQRRTSLLPSLYDTSSHASLVRSKTARKSADISGSRVIGRVHPRPPNPGRVVAPVEGLRAAFYGPAIGGGLGSLGPALFRQLRSATEYALLQPYLATDRLFQLRLRLISSCVISFPSRSRRPSPAWR